MIAPDIVEVDVDAVRRDRGEALENWTVAIVDDLVGAEGTDEVTLLAAAGRANHGHAPGLGELHHDRTDSSRRRRDEDDVTLLGAGDVEEPEIGSRAGNPEHAEELLRV